MRSINIEHSERASPKRTDCRPKDDVHVPQLVWATRWVGVSSELGAAVAPTVGAVERINPRWYQLDLVCMKIFKSS